MSNKVFYTRLRRDLWNRKFQVFILIVVIGIGGGSYWGMLSTVDSARESVYDLYNNYFIDDGIVYFPQEFGINMSQINSLMNHFPSAYKINVWELRYKQPISFEVNTSDKFSIINGYIYGINITSLSNNTIDRLMLREGHLLTPSDNNESHILLDNNFSKQHNLQISSSINIRTQYGTFSTQIVGSVTSPEWLILINPESTTFAMANLFGVGFVPLTSLQSFLGIEDKINELVFKLNPNYDLNVFIQELSDYLSLQALSFSIQKRSTFPSYKIIVEDIENDKESLQAIAIMIFIVAIFGLWISMNRLITHQRREIGIDLSLGVTNYKIMSYYLIYGIIIGIFGILVSLFLGAIILDALTNVYQDAMNLPVIKSYTNLNILFESMILALFCSFLASLLPAWQASKLLPIKALRQDPALSATYHFKFPILNWLLFPIIHYSLNARMALRNILRNRRRTFTTIKGIALSISLAIFMVGSMDTFDYAINNYSNELGDWDIRVTFYQPLPNGITTIITNNSEIEKYTYGLVYFATIQTDKENKLVQLISYNTSIIPVKTINGPFLNNGSGITLSKTLGENLDINLNDNITIEHIAFEGSSSYYIINSTLQVQLWHSRVSRLEVFVPWVLMQQLVNVTNSANQLLLNLHSTNVNTFRTYLYSLPFVKLVETHNEPVSDAIDLMSMFRDLFNIMDAGAFTLAFSVIVLTSMITRSERTREYGTMLSLGTSNSKIFKISIWEASYLALISIFMGFIIGWLVLVYYMVPTFGEEFSNFVVNPYVNVGCSAEPQCLEKVGH